MLPWVRRFVLVLALAPALPLFAISISFRVVPDAPTDLAPVHPTSRGAVNIVLSSYASPIWALVASTDATTGEIDIVTP